MKRIVAILLALLLPAAALAEGQSTLTASEFMLYEGDVLSMDMSKLALALGWTQSEQGEAAGVSLTAGDWKYDFSAALAGDALTLTASFLEDAYRITDPEAFSAAMADALESPWGEPPAGPDGNLFSVGDIELAAETHGAFEIKDVRLDEVLGGAGAFEPFRLKADRYFAPASEQTGYDDITAYVFTLEQMGDGPDRPYAQLRLYDFRGGADQSHRMELTYSLSRDEETDGQMAYDGRVQEDGGGRYREAGPITWTHGAWTLTANCAYESGPAPDGALMDVGRKSVIEAGTMSDEQAAALQRQLMTAVMRVAGSIIQAAPDLSAAVAAMMPKQ